MSEKKALYGTSRFPVEVVESKSSILEPGSERPHYSAVPMSVGTGPGSKYVFGMNKEATAALLRALAEDIETGRVVLLQGAVTSKVKNDDFAQTWVTVKISEPI